MDQFRLNFLKFFKPNYRRQLNPITYNCKDLINHCLNKNIIGLVTVYNNNVFFKKKIIPEQLVFLKKIHVKNKFINVLFF